MPYFYLLMTVFLFSTLEITGKLIGVDIPPVSVTVFRFLIGGLFLLPPAVIQLRKKKIKLHHIDYSKMLFMGFLNVVIAMLFLQYAVYYGKASISAILISANPIFVAIFASIILQEKLSFSRIIGLTIGLLGVFLIIKPELSISGKAMNPLLGIIFGVISSASFGLYTVLNKKFVSEYSSLIINSFSFLLGSLLLFLLSLIFHFPIEFEPSIKNFSFLLYLGIFVTGIAYWLYFEGLKKVSTVTGSMFFFIKPLIASFLAYLIFHEHLLTCQYLGFFFVLLGILSQNIFLPRNCLQIENKSSIAFSRKKTTR